MGIIIRQSLKAGFVAYIGVAIGISNHFFFSTKYLSPEQLAITKVLWENSLMFASFAHLGAPFIIDKFFPIFKDEDRKHNGFLVFALLFPLVGLIIFSVLYFVLSDYIAAYFIKESPMLAKYHILCVPITFLGVYVMVLEAYTRSHARIAIPTFIREVVLKSYNILLIVIFALGWINFDFLVYGVASIHLISVVFLLLYIKHLKKLFLKPDWHLFTKERFLSILKYGSFVVLGGVGTTAILFLDRNMLASSKGLVNVSIFIIANSIVQVIEMPRTMLKQMSIPFLSQALQENNILQLKELYQKLSLHQLVVGFWVFLMIACSIDQIFLVLPKGEIYQAGKYVVLLLGVSKLIELSNGSSFEIIFYSKYYRFSTYFLLLMLLASIAGNLLLIPIYDYNGAAFVTLAVTILYSIIRIVFVWLKFKIAPYQTSQLVISVGAILVGLSVFWIEIDSKNILLQLFLIVAKCSWITLAYGVFIWKGNFSSEINGLINKTLAMIPFLRNLVKK